MSSKWITFQLSPPQQAILPFQQQDKQQQELNKNEKNIVASGKDYSRLLEEKRNELSKKKPEKEKRKILGTLFSSTLFQNRAPKNYALLTTFVGGERNPELANLPESSILSLVKNELTHTVSHIFIIQKVFNTTLFLVT